jgi:hypothetical protein
MYMCWFHLFPLKEICTIRFRWQLMLIIENSKIKVSKQNFLHISIWNFLLWDLAAIRSALFYTLLKFAGRYYRNCVRRIKIISRSAVLQLGLKVTIQLNWVSHHVICVIRLARLTLEPKLSALSLGGQWLLDPSLESRKGKKFSLLQKFQIVSGYNPPLY